MTDLHCHVLPGLDDGAGDFAEALDMCRVAVEDGITEIVATPHTEDGLYRNCGTKICEAVRLFQEALVQERIPLAVYPGAEVHIHENLIDHIRQGQVLTLGNNRKYILLELPSTLLPLYTDHVIRRLLEEGITPLIAHPERNEQVRRNQERLQAWVALGACVQLNAGSLLGFWGKQIRQCATFLLRSGYVHVIASDGHDAQNRPPVLSKAYREVEKAVSPDAREVLEANAKAVLAGGMCKTISQERSPRKWFFCFSK